MIYKNCVFAAWRLCVDIRCCAQHDRHFAYQAYHIDHVNKIKKFDSRRVYFCDFNVGTIHVKSRDVTFVF